MMPRKNSRSRKEVVMNESMSSVEVYQQKLKQAKRLIDIHNYLRKPTLQDNRVVYEDFVKNLLEIGGATDEMLRQVTAEDLHSVCKLPVLMARRLAEIFQQSQIDLKVDAHGAVVCKSEEA